MCAGKTQWAYLLEDGIGRVGLVLVENGMRRTCSGRVQWGGNKLVKASATHPAPAKLAFLMVGRLPPNMEEGVWPELALYGHSSRIEKPIVLGEFEWFTVETQYMHRCKIGGWV